ncbi:MAG: hypothetical protein QM733_03380 [Ilumatobacteraceae bacterium]
MDRDRPHPEPIAGGRVVVYALALPGGGGGRSSAIWRFAGSVSTLRAHNAELPVVLFAFGDVPAELATICAVHGVELRPLEPFGSRLAELSPTGWSVFVGEPLLARLLVFHEVVELAPAQVLLCDQHAVVDADVADLFDLGHGADLVAGEEPHSARSGHHVDRRLLDEPLLARLAAQEGVPAVPPFDPGVVLLNNELWSRLAALQPRLVDYAWRLAVGASLRPGQPALAASGIDLAAMRATDDDVLRALPFPSVDRRLLVEVAWWLTLGHVDGLRTDDFAALERYVDLPRTLRPVEPVRSGARASGASGVLTRQEAGQITLPLLSYMDRARSASHAS